MQQVIEADAEYMVLVHCNGCASQGDKGNEYYGCQIGDEEVFYVQVEQNCQILVSGRAEFALPELDAPNALSPPGPKLFSKTGGFSWTLTVPLNYVND